VTRRTGYFSCRVTVSNLSHLICFQKHERLVTAVRHARRLARAYKDRPDVSVEVVEAVGGVGVAKP